MNRPAVRPTLVPLSAAAFVDVLAAILECGMGNELISNSPFRIPH